MNNFGSQPGPEKPANKKNWLRRLGILGFLFFLLKGIAWLFVFYYGVKFSGCRSESKPAAYIFSGSSIPSIDIA
ncbi:MAG: hypothetical protein QM743_13435 [Chitinophagaceae bacterium]